MDLPRGRPLLLALRTAVAVRLAPWLFQTPEPKVLYVAVPVPVDRVCECEQRIADAIHSFTEGEES